MNKQNQFWPLLRNELTPTRFGELEQLAAMGIVLLSYWSVLVAFPWVLLFGDSTAHGNLATLFESNLAPIMLVPYIGFMTLWMAYTVVPAFRDILSPGNAMPGIQYPGAFEFFFTKAVNRRLLFRARAAAHLLVLLTPLLGDVGAALLFKNTVVLYCAWLVWCMGIVFFLVQSYAVFVAKWVKADNWWTAFYLVPALPILIVGSFYFSRPSFFLFVAHPLAMLLALAAFAVLIQRQCEQRFSQLEIM